MLLFWPLIEQFEKREKEREKKEDFELTLQFLQRLGIGRQPLYQSPYLSRLDPAIANTLLARMGRSANWGWPAGKGIDTSLIESTLGRFYPPEGFGGGGNEDFLKILRRFLPVGMERRLQGLTEEDFKNVLQKIRNELG